MSDRISTENVEIDAAGHNHFELVCIAFHDAAMARALQLSADRGETIVSSDVINEVLFAACNDVRRQFPSALEAREPALVENVGA